MVCEGASYDNETCFASEEEEAYVRNEIVRLEYMLDNDDLEPASNIRRTFAHKTHVVIREELWDVYYKRWATSILLKRERQVEYYKTPEVRPTSLYFADLNDPTYLI